jgi:hypothetical protein
MDTIPNVIHYGNQGGGKSTQQKKQAQLNPAWIEWLMGWPIGWTDSKPLGMGKFRQWRRLHLQF